MSQKSKRGISCSITAFHVEAPPSDGVTGPHEWMAVATSHIYDSPPSDGNLTEAQAILAGAVMKVIEGRASAATEEQALAAALRALLFQLEALGYSRSTE